MKRLRTPVRVRNHSVEKPTGGAGLQARSRIHGSALAGPGGPPRPWASAAPSRLLIASGGAPRHGHSLTVAAQYRHTVFPSRGREGAVRVLRLILTALSLALCAGAAEYQLHLAPENTQVNWTLGDVLHTVHGTFKLRRGDIVFDSESGKAGGEVVVDATSGESGSGARDGRMHKNVLESSKYPDVSFTPDHLEGKVELTGVSNIKLHGTFRIHGGAHEITVPVKVSANGGSLDAEIKFEVPFVAWGMKDPSTLFLRVNKSVEIVLRATGRLSQPATARANAQ